MFNEIEDYSTGEEEEGGQRRKKSGRKGNSKDM